MQLRRGVDSSRSYFFECDEITLSDLFGSDSINRVTLRDADSVLMSTPAVYRINDKYIALCQPFGFRQGLARDSSYLGNSGRVGRDLNEYIVPMEILPNDSDTVYIVDKGKEEILSDRTTTRINRKDVIAM